MTKRNAGKSVKGSRTKSPSPHPSATPTLRSGRAIRSRHDFRLRTAACRAINRECFCFVPLPPPSDLRRSFTHPCLQVKPWLRRPLAQESPQAAEAEKLFLQGRAHFRGEGAPQDDVRARELLLKSAEMGNVKAMNNLGMMYADGRGGAVNGTEAAKWLTKAAEAGVALSQMNLGLLYAEGKGVAKDSKLAAEWLKKAADQGFTDAESKLGLLYFRGTDNLKPDYRQAVQWFAKAAEKGHSTAQNALGVCYEQGLGVEVNIDRAAELFQKSAEQGDAKGMSNLGRLYSVGKGVPEGPCTRLQLAYAQRGKEGGHRGEPPL